MIIDSTGGASRGSEYPPVLFSPGFDDFLATLDSRGIRCDSVPDGLRIYETCGFDAFLPYLSFAGAEGVGGFRDTVALESLDRDLRMAMLRAVGVVERQAKAQYSKAMTSRHGVRCLADPSNFNDAAAHGATMSSLARELKRRARKDRVLRTAVERNQVTCEMSVGASTLGTLSRLVGNTNDAEALGEVGASFGQDVLRLVSWLRTLAAVRNACAHFDAYCVRKQIPCVPRRVRGCGEDPASPMYVLLVIEAMLAGRECFLGRCADGELARFRLDVGAIVAALESDRPYLVEALRVPGSFCGRGLPHADSRECALPWAVRLRTPSAARYGVVLLAA